jgi:hypothetical protein
MSKPLTTPFSDLTTDQKLEHMFDLWNDVTKKIDGMEVNMGAKINDIGARGWLVVVGCMILRMMM